MNSRMIQAVFDDANATTRPLWNYPDGSAYDADRQTNEFVSNLTSYVACGLDAFTVGMQGGGPQVATPPDQPWISSGFDGSGNPLPAYLDRLTRVLQGAATAGIVPIVQFFYQGQIERLTSGDAAVVAAVDAMTQYLLTQTPWARSGDGRPLLLDIANEVGAFNMSYTTLQRDTIATLIQRVKRTARGQLLVSSSFLGAAAPTDSAVNASDFVLIHCNGETPAQIAVHLATVRALPSYQAHPKPIVFNECGTDLTVMRAAVQGGAGWGYYAQGASNYSAGFQSPPTNWRPDSDPSKRAFFALVANLTASTC